MSSSLQDWKNLALPSAFWFQEGPGVRNWQFTTSGVKLLNVANIEKGGTLNLAKTTRYLDAAEVNQKYSHFLIDHGDLVIASSGISFDVDGLLRTRGAFVDTTQLPLCLNTSTIRFKAIANVSDLNYLRHWINGLDFRTQVTKLVTGSAQQNFGPSHLKAIKISLPPLPPLPEQRRIAAILDQAETLRTQRRTALALLDTLTQSIFLDMFDDPVTNPRGWKKLSFNEACETRLGKMLDARQQTGQNKRRYLRNANVQWFRIDVFDLLEMDFDSNARKTFALQKGDLLICEGGEPGRAAVWQGELEDVYYQKALHRGRPKTGVANSDYLAWLLWFLAQRGGLGDHVTAATIAHLTRL